MNRKMSTHFYEKSDDAPEALRLIENIFLAAGMLVALAFHSQDEKFCFLFGIPILSVRGRKAIFQGSRNINIV